MKHLVSLSLTFILLFSSELIFCQKSCTVLKQELSGTYEGKCKNGLANGRGIASGKDTYKGMFVKGLPQGEGTYTWSNGSTYTGEWIEGKRHGIGKYTFKVNEHDSIQDGLWQNDSYKGAKPENPKVTYASGVDRYNFKKSNSALNRVSIDITQNGVRNKKISNLNISSSSGQDISSGFLIGYNNVVFPVSIKISYLTLNKLGSSNYPVNFNFVIYEPGDWKVEITN